MRERNCQGCLRSSNVPHYISSKFNVDVQHLTLLKATKAAAAVPPPHGEESSTRRSLLLRVCVHRQSQFTHQQLLQYAAFLPRVHRMETEAPIRAPGKCKLSCVVPLSVCVYCLPLVVCLLKTVELISSEANRKIAHVVCEMQDDLIVPHLCDQSPRLGWKFFCSLWRSHRETVALILCGSFALVGPQAREGNKTSLLSEFTCQWSHSLVGDNLVALCWLLQSGAGLNLAEFFFQSFALVG